MDAVVEEDDAPRADAATNRYERAEQETAEQLEPAPRSVSPKHLEARDDSSDARARAARLVARLFPPDGADAASVKAARHAAEAAFASDSTFVGDLELDPGAVGERRYGEYARTAADWSRLAAGDAAADIDAASRAARSAEARRDFRDALRERDLDPRDVAAVRELDASSCVAAVVPRGAYVGLPQITSARDVAAAVFDELDSFTGPARRETRREAAEGSSAALVEDAPPEGDELAACVARLKRRGAAAADFARGPPDDAAEGDAEGGPARRAPGLALDADGVVNQITSRLAGLREARSFYAGALDEDRLAAQRSALASDDDVALYCTYVRAEDWLRDGAMHHALREGVARPVDLGDLRRDREVEAPPAAPAPLSSTPAAPAPLVRTEGDELLADFELGAHGLYARRDNKYMLFNEDGARAARVSIAAFRAATAAARAEAAADDANPVSEA